MGKKQGALIVEDNPSLARSLAEVLEERDFLVKHGPSVRAAKQALEGWVPQLVILDFMLPDGTGLDVLAALAPLRPQPVVVAISGEAGPEESFQLARAGVRCFLRKPFRLQQVRAAVEEAMDATPDPTVEARAAVGKVAIKDLEAEIRRAMVGEALARSGGSVRGAAALLGISRQLLQHILKSPEHEGKIPR